MKIQLNILFACIKKCLKWFILLISFVLIFLFVVEYNMEVGTDEFLILIGSYKYNSYDLFRILFFIFNFTITVYFSYIFYNYELENSLDNIVLRSDYRKWIREKFIVLILFVLVFRLLYSMFLFLLIGCNIIDNIYITLSLIFSHIFVAISIVFLINHKRNNKMLFITIFIICILEVLLSKYLIMFNILLCIMIIVYELLTFNFKKII